MLYSQWYCLLAQVCIKIKNHTFSIFLYQRGLRITRDWVQRGYSISEFKYRYDSSDIKILQYHLSLEQHSIATFLDPETARINTLIEKKERLIELFQEKRAALISHAVTKGLDPTVPMKDSGVEWLGEIPAHWEVKRLKRLYQNSLWMW